MDFAALLDLFLHIDQTLLGLVVGYGPWIYALLFAVIFCETGLVVMPFLPGDTLLFAAGAVAALGDIDPWLVFGVMSSAAVLGDSINYWIGRTLGTRLFRNPASKVFRKDYLDEAHAFFQRHGGKTVAVARFLPIFRTFVPCASGISKMYYPRFLSFSILGTLCWVGSLVLVGYLFGKNDFIRQHLSLIVIALFIISMLPVLVKAMAMRAARRTKPLPPAAQASGSPSGKEP